MMTGLTGLALRTLTGAVALASLTAAAAAQVTPEQQSAIRSNCRPDFMSKCSGVTPGGKDALQCLQKNVAALSPGCKTAVSATIPAPPVPAPLQHAAPAPTPPPPPAAAAPPQTPQPAAPAVAPAAATPRPAALPTVRQAPPKPAQLAKPFATPKSAPPLPVVVAAPMPAEAAPAPTPEQMKAIRFTCRREFANHCRSVLSGGTEAIDCLQRIPGKLSPDCKTSLAALDGARPSGPGTPPPLPAGTPKAPVVMTAVIGRACLRDLALHCRDIKVGDGRKIACLTERGPALSPLCKAALKITEPIR